jgi:hypothetical protein
MDILHSHFRYDLGSSEARMGLRVLKSREAHTFLIVQAPQNIRSLETSLVLSNHALLPRPRYYGVGYGLYLRGSQDGSVNL